ncbi:MAG: hypothetical protein DRR08_14405 [Candidatus Parabeggiatoa sp. nov. 2]|nr:MAG: hypothetical protein B6247_20565 [Beggiatoa sp. 4572_84]RKZ59265.1 MAG: hypothetical protein DRR08_14405 [Gammaproteobacteria bacterium]HEC86047.1 hypothetical protein [Thioploca sp.]
MKTSYVPSFFKRAWLVVLIIACLNSVQVFLAADAQTEAANIVTAFDKTKVVDSKTKDDGWLKTLIIVIEGGDSF